MIRLGLNADKRLIIASDEPLPSDIERVEYYRDQKLFMFVYEDKNHEDQLMPIEMSDDISDIVKSSAEVIIVALAQEGQEPYEYLAPLVQIGV